MSDISGLEAWRRDVGEIRWRERPERWWSQQRREEREKRRKVRLQRDRKHFGEELWGVSELQRNAQFRPDIIKLFGLPIIRSEAELARWLEIPLSRLRWLTHDKPSDTVWHYIKFTIPKRSGGQRVILAPKTDLKRFQRKILADLLGKMAPHDNAHGFVPEHSILTNAQPHVGKKFVLNLDLKDFFPGIIFPRVRGLFIAHGYSFAVASALALLCTEREREKLERSRETYWIGVGPRALVQGAPTSPALANLVAWNLDIRLSGLARKHGFAYTRYADDLTFSGDDHDKMLRILSAARRIIADEGFTVHPDKLRIYRQSSQQNVTGLVVNDKVNVPRTLRRQIRAILHNAQKTGLEAQNRDGREDFRAYLQGMIGYIAQANPQEATKLSDMLRRVL